MIKEGAPMKSSRSLSILLALLPALMTGTPVVAAQAPDAFAAHFVQTRTLPGFEQPLVSHGEMRFSAAEGFHWQIDKPYRYVFDMREGEASEELPDGTRRTLEPDQTPWLKAVERMFVGALSGDQARLERYFNVTIEPLEHGRHVSLEPRPGALAQVITRIEVTETAPGHPQRLEIDEVSGAHMDVRFTPMDAGGEH